MNYESEEDYKNVDTSIIVPEERQKSYYPNQGRVDREQKKAIMNSIPIHKQYRSVTLHGGYIGN